MIIFALILLGLCLGSFVNALVWRLRRQEEIGDQIQALEAKKTSVATKTKLKKLRLTTGDYSIMTGRSMCTDCRHTLAWYDLIPVLSWASTLGRCRYCHKPVSPQYPLVELLTAGLFLLSYFYWPAPIRGVQVAVFAIWLLLIVGFMALFVYDLRWLILPNKIVFPLTALAAVQAAIIVGTSARPLHSAANTLLAVTVGGGIFFVLYQISGGKWIGGGDVKLGWLFGLVVATPLRSLMVIFIAALLGTIAALPSLILRRLKTTSIIPFGPFLIAGIVLVELFGASIMAWYLKLLLP